jgi:hypothetical protein
LVQRELVSPDSDEQTCTALSFKEERYEEIGERPFQAYWFRAYADTPAGKVMSAVILYTLQAQARLYLLKV